MPHNISDAFVWLAYPLGLENTFCSRGPGLLFFLTTVPAPLVDFGAIQTELLREDDDAVRVEPWVLLVLLLQNYLLLLVEVASSQALARLVHAVVTAVDIGRLCSI